MTFDFARAGSLPFMLPYNPDPVPGWTWAPQGFWLPFTGNDQIDTSHSLNYVFMENGRSMVSPSRSQGSTILSEGFSGGMTGYSLVQTGTAVARASIAADGYPGVVGHCITLGTGLTAGSVAGIERTLGTIPDSFSYAIQLNTQSVGASPLDACHVWVQNNAAVTLMTRYYNGLCEVFDGYGWHWLGNIGGPGIFSECWVECHDNGDGTHTVKLYGGCQCYGIWSGVIPTGQLTNNGIAILQQSGANAARMSMVLHFDVGPTQLPDNMTYCTPAFGAQPPPTQANVKLFYEDVSRDCCAGINLHVFVTSQNTGSWIEVPLADYGIVGKGELDVTADVHCVAGSVALPTQGTSMRAYVSSNSGAFPVLQGLTVFWQ